MISARLLKTCMPEQLYTKEGMSDLAYPEAFVHDSSQIKTYMPKQLYTKEGMFEQLYTKACICNHCGHSYAQKLCICMHKSFGICMHKSLAYIFTT